MKIIYRSAYLSYDLNEKQTNRNSSFPACEIVDAKRRENMKVNLNHVSPTRDTVNAYLPGLFHQDDDFFQNQKPLSK